MAVVQLSTGLGSTSHWLRPTPNEGRRALGFTCMLPTGRRNFRVDAYSFVFKKLTTAGVVRVCIDLY